MAFLDSIVKRAWQRAGGRCECRRTTHDHYGRCGKALVWVNRDREGRGKWEAHSVSGLHRGSASDCQILCWGCHRSTF
jgi:hypothetical protein